MTSNSQLNFYRSKYQECRSSIMTSDIIYIYICPARPVTWYICCSSALPMHIGHLYSSAPVAWYISALLLQPLQNIAGNITIPRHIGHFCSSAPVAWYICCSSTPVVWYICCSLTATFAVYCRYLNNSKTYRTLLLLYDFLLSFIFEFSAASDDWELCMVCLATSHQLLLGSFHCHK